MLILIEHNICIYTHTQKNLQVLWMCVFFSSFLRGMGFYEKQE